MLNAMHVIMLATEIINLDYFEANYFAFLIIFQFATIKLRIVIISIIIILKFVKE
jgi:hypothetical protein